MLQDVICFVLLSKYLLRTLLLGGQYSWFLFGGGCHIDVLTQSPAILKFSVFSSGPFK
jgi:hypothetical protein